MYSVAPPPISFSATEVLIYLDNSSTKRFLASLKSFATPPLISITFICLLSDAICSAIVLIESTVVLTSSFADF